MSTITLEDAISRFVKAALANYSPTRQPKMGYAEVNRNARAIHNSAMEIIAEGDAGLKALSGLLGHEDPGVALMAAVYSLKQNTDLALSRLKELAKDSGLLGFRATESIRRWDAGEWQLDQLAHTEAHSPDIAIDRSQFKLGAEPPTLLDALNKITRKVRWSDIRDRGRFDERRSLIDAVFQNIIGVQQSYVSWCPNDDPPSRDESLAFLWVIRPEFGEEIMQTTKHSGLREVIQEYEAASG